MPKWLMDTLRDQLENQMLRKEKGRERFSIIHILYTGSQNALLQLKD